MFVPVEVTADDPAVEVLVGRPVAVAQSYSSLVKNTGSATVYLGGDDTVTDTDGFPLEPGEVATVSGVGNDDTLFAFAATPQTLRVLEAR